MRNILATTAAVSLTLFAPSFAQVATEPAEPAPADAPMTGDAESVTGEAIEETGDALESAGDDAEAVAEDLANEAESAGEAVDDAVESTSDSASEVIDDMTADDAPEANAAETDVPAADAPVADAPEPDATATDDAADDTGVPTDPAIAVPPLMPVDLSQVTVEQLTGIDVRNDTNESLGEVDDVTLSSDGAIEGIVVGFGGFLGFGEKKVLLGLDEVEVMSRGDEDYVIVTSITPEALEAMPEYSE